MRARTKQPATLEDALRVASDYWESKGPSSRMMSTRAKACVALVPKDVKLACLLPTHGTAIITGLQNAGKSRASVQSYYAAFRRMVELGGGDCRGWPAPGKPPRRTREALSEDSLVALEEQLGCKWTVAKAQRWVGSSTWARGDAQPDGHWSLADETLDLLYLLRGTAMRVDVEALAWDATEWNPEKRTLRITGKGEHERIIPVEDPETVALLGDPERLARMRRISYSGHLKRWNRAVAAANITSLKPTPHAVRHYAATRFYHKSSKDLIATQRYLGHADPGTTARYIGVDVEDMREAVR